MAEALPCSATAARPHVGCHPESSSIGQGAGCSTREKLRHGWPGVPWFCMSGDHGCASRDQSGSESLWDKHWSASSPGKERKLHPMRAEVTGSWNPPWRLEMRSFWHRCSHHTTDLIGHEAPACSGLAPYCQCPQAKKNRFSGFPDLFPFHNPGHAQMLFPTMHTEVHSRTRLIFTRTWRNFGVQTNCVWTDFKVLTLMGSEASQTLPPGGLVPDATELSLPEFTGPSLDISLIWYLVNKGLFSVLDSHSTGRQRVGWGADYLGGQAPAISHSESSTLPTSVPLHPHFHSLGRRVTHLVTSPNKNQSPDVLLGPTKFPVHSEECQLSARLWKDPISDQQGWGKAVWGRVRRNSCGSTADSESPLEAVFKMS